MDEIERLNAKKRNYEGKYQTGVYSQDDYEYKREVVDKNIEKCKHQQEKKNKYFSFDDHLFEE